MNAIVLAERRLIPDPLIRLGIRKLNRKRLIKECSAHETKWQQAFDQRLQELKESPIAIETAAANEQHYEVPAAFFRACLGKHLKYSSGYWPDSTSTLDQSEAAMLALTCERAKLDNGQQILELGCGWGSLTLWMAEHYPDSLIHGVSNSHSQRQFIMQQAKQRGLSNIDITTADVNHFTTEQRFDRVVSIEMFEHMRNYQILMQQISHWLKPAGMLFVHIFCHHKVMYPFQVEGSDDWMSKYFFTGGLMPSYDTLSHFQDHLQLQERWQVSGSHYQRTANAWLNQLDKNRAEIMPLLQSTYGTEAAIWLQRWRIFFMACAELFGHRDGNEWLVGHYRFVNRAW